MKQKRRCNELTVMSGIAILMVLGIHGCASALNRFCPGSGNYADAETGLRILSNLVAPAVPMFLFVSGYKYALNDLDTPYPVFLGKRLPRVIISFAVINTFFWILDSMTYMTSFDAMLLAKTYLHSWVGYSVAYQLWYIPMYCFVLILCPVMRFLIPADKLRFCVWAGLGIIQRILEGPIPALGTYPIRFISYPVFFELGVLACTGNWKTKFSNRQRLLASGGYILFTVLLSLLAPAVSADGLTKYMLYYFGGTVSFYSLSMDRSEDAFLHWAGNRSYPLFLLHEPVIGRLVGSLLNHIPLNGTVHALCWVSLDLAFTLIVIRILKRLHADWLL